MVKCHKCGAGWTSQGMTICPICNTKVELAGPSSKATAPPELVSAVAAPKGNHQAVMEAPPEPPKFTLKKVEPLAPVVVAKKVEPPVEPRIEPRVEPRIESRVDPSSATAVLRERPAATVKTEIRKPETRLFERMQLSDPSALAIPAIRELPMPARPLNGPLILGALAYVGVLLLPITMAFESNRVLGILGFCMTAFFAPFAPIAWMVGLAAEKRRREQGLRPEKPVALGRLLGQWATLTLVSEFTLALVAVAILRLAGRFPLSFWTPFY